MNEYAGKQAQQAAYDAQIRASQCLGTLHNGTFEAMQGCSTQQRQSSMPPAPPPIGVLGMTENAHSSFQQLSNALSELSDRLGPMTESYPEPGCAASTANQISEASAVVGLRILVERIDGKTAEIYRLLAALRV